MLKRFTFFSLACLFCGAQIACADVKLAGIFGDHMVLQQGVKLPVWGWADPGQHVTVTLGYTSAATTTAVDGTWRVDIAPLEASDRAIQFIVTGKNTVTLNDVVVGDVWLASGQSNMEFSLKSAANSADALAHADQPGLRLCSVGNNPSLHPISDRQVRWSRSTAASAKSFSAVAYYFGADLLDHVNVPVGIIGAYVAGTPAQSWTNREALQTAPELKHYLDALSEAETAAATRESKENAGVPTSLYNGMIAPLCPMALSGIIWYQGESNTSQAAEYRVLFPALIEGWRNQWHAPDMPFLFVQLPGFGRRKAQPAPSDWAMLREAQTMALKLPHTGMAVTIDTSAPRAILHPKNKLEVGHRLALVARRMVYGESISDSGPIFQSMQITGGAIRVHFIHTDGGLVLGAPPTEKAPSPASRPSQLIGFAVAGPDHQFVTAQATIDGDSVVISSDAVKNPIAVRYGWADNPAVDLYNAAGLPAAPFRTDDWPN